MARSRVCKSQSEEPPAKAVCTISPGLGVDKGVDASVLAVRWKDGRENADQSRSECRALAHAPRSDSNGATVLKG